MKYYLSVKDEFGDFVHYRVTKEVYFYVQYLELCIKCSEHIDKLEAEYPDRFEVIIVEPGESITVELKETHYIYYEKEEE